MWQQFIFHIPSGVQTIHWSGIGFSIPTVWLLLKAVISASLHGGIKHLSAAWNISKALYQAWRVDQRWMRRWAGRTGVFAHRCSDRHDVSFWPGYTWSVYTIDYQLKLLHTTHRRKTTEACRCFAAEKAKQESTWALCGILQSLSKEKKKTLGNVLS